MSDIDAEKVAQLRELIPATAAGIYLDTAYRGPLPAESAAAMREADDWELRVGRATEGRAEDMEQRVAEASSVLAALIGADPSEIVLTPGVEAALALAERLARPNQLVITRQVDPGVGTYLGGGGPAARSGQWVAADASLVAGAVPLEAGSTGADYVVFACDRWLLGPEETAALWIGPRSRNRESVATSSGLGRTAVLGLARSVGWLEMYVGLDWIYERGERLTRRLHEVLNAEHGVEVLTPPEAIATTVMFRFAAWPVQEALEALRRRVFAILGTSGDGAALRASVAWFNTEEEIDRFGRAVAEIAAHTPETLPRRPNLIVQ